MEKKLIFVVLVFMSLDAFAQSRFDYTIGDGPYQTVVAGTSGDTLITAEHVVFFNYYDPPAPYKYERDGKTYFVAREYFNYIIDGDSTLKKFQNYYRQDGKKVYYLPSIESSDEMLLVDYGLVEGDLFDSPYNGTMRVESIVDTVLNNKTYRLFHLRSSSDPSVTDEWIESVGSLKTGFLPPELVAKIKKPRMTCAMSQNSFNSPDINTDIVKTLHYMPQKVENIEEPPVDKNEGSLWCEFIGDTLHVKGYLYENAAVRQNEMLAYMQGNDIFLEKRIASYTMVWGMAWYLHDLKFPGFKPGTYHVSCNVYELYYRSPSDGYILSNNYMDTTIECKGNTASVPDIQANARTSASPAIYDLTGRRLTAEPTRGVYIRDGKKVWKVKN